MIKSAFIVPHSPLLIPAIAKGNSMLVEKTATSYAKIREKIAEANIDSILIISPHGPVQPRAFVIQTSWKLQARFDDFGDFSSKAEFNGDPETAYKLKEATESHFPIRLSSEERLDYGSAIPLFTLMPEIANLKVVQISYSGLSLEDHINYGSLLGAELEKSSKNWAIIASGDLSHRLTRNAPGGYSSKAAKFDNKVIEYLNDPEIAASQIAKIDNKLTTEVKECGLKSIAILLGTIKDWNYQPQVLSYQSDLGIGYLTMAFSPEAKPEL